MSWNWSTDWTTQAGVDFTDLTNGPFPMFWRAFRERHRVAYGQDSGAADGTDMPAAGADALVTVVTAYPASHTPQPGALSWGTLQAQVDWLATYFVRSGSWVGTNLIKNMRYGDGANTTIDRAFPYPNGWSRAFPRTIYALSQPGSAGQRARFEAYTGQHYYGVLSTDPLFGTFLSTPTGENSNTGKFFEYTGGAWTLSTDQQSPADVVTENGVLAQPGDYITGQFLNDLRDAINQLTQTIVNAGNENGYLITWTNVQSYNPNLAYPVSDFLPPDDIYGRGSGTSIASADAAYVGGNNWPWASSNPVTGFREVSGSTSVSYGNYEVQDCSSVFANTMVKWPYAVTANWYFVGVEHNILTGGYTFDAQGTTALNHQWQQFGSTNQTANMDYIIGPRLPGASPTPAPNWSNIGWDVALRAGILNWAVASGFTYVSGYAGT